MDKNKHQRDIEILREMIPYFKSKGMEVGVWVWTFWRSELNEEYLEDCMQVQSSGEKRVTETTLNTTIKNHSGFCCPASKKFVDEAMDIIKKIAELNPDIIMFDDDYRFGNLGGYSGCYCKHHLKMVSEKLGREITRQELFQKVYEGKPNPERMAFIEALGESMESFAVRVRETVDSVNSEIRFALCSVLSLWDNDGVGIAFGENARHLTKEAMENGLILDIRAAKILTEQGIDVGIEEIGENITKDLLYYPDYNEYVKANYTPHSAYKLNIRKGARVVTYSTDNGEELFADSFLYENKQGGRFLVLGFDAAFTEFNSYRTYCMQKMLYSACEWLSGKKLPAKCQGNPGMYILTKKDTDGNMAVGLWNIFEDETLETTAQLDGEYSSAEIIGAVGKLEGDKVIIENIPAFKFCFINLKR